MFSGVAIDLEEGDVGEGWAGYFYDLGAVFGKGTAYGWSGDDAA